MVLPIKPICKANKIRKYGTSLIFIQYCFSARKRTLLNTDYKIPEEDSDAIYLSHEEIVQIYQTDLSAHPNLV